MENETNNEILTVELRPMENVLRDEYDDYDEGAYNSDEIQLMFEQLCETIEVEEGEIFEVPEDYKGYIDDEHDYYSDERDYMPIDYLCCGKYRFEKITGKGNEYVKYLIVPIGNAIIRYQ